VTPSRAPRSFAGAGRAGAWAALFAVLYSAIGISLVREPVFLLASILFGIAAAVGPAILRRWEPVFGARPSPGARAVIAVSASLLFGALLAANRAFVTDDAYIYLRYAQTLVEWGQLQFNAGDRANALAGPLWAILLAPAFLTADPETSARAIAALVGLATLVVPCAIFRSAWACLVYALVVATYYPFVVWTLGGLETPLLALGLLLITLLAVRQEREPRRPALAALAAGAVYLVRADAILFPLGLVLAGALARDRMRSRIVGLVQGLAALAVIPALTVALNLVYYESPFPESLRVKGPGSGGAALAAAVAYGVNHLAEFLSVGFLIVPIAWLLAGLRTGGMRLGTGSRGVLLGAGLYAAWIVVCGEIHMMFTYRFYVPLVPAVLAALLAETERLSRLDGSGPATGVEARANMSRERFSRHPATASMLVVFALAISVPNGVLMSVRGFHRGMFFERHSKSGDPSMAGLLQSIDAYRACGRYLAEAARPGERLYSQVLAIIPFYSGLYALDDWLVTARASRFADLRAAAGRPDLIEHFDWVARVEWGASPPLAPRGDRSFELATVCPGRETLRVAVYRRGPPVRASTLLARENHQAVGDPLRGPRAREGAVDRAEPPVDRRQDRSERGPVEDRGRDQVRDGMDPPRPDRGEPGAPEHRPQP
jgi:hypothetical protein